MAFGVGEVTLYLFLALATAPLAIIAVKYFLKPDYLRFNYPWKNEWRLGVLSILAHFLGTVFICGAAVAPRYCSRIPLACWVSVLRP